VHLILEPLTAGDFIAVDTVDFLVDHLRTCGDRKFGPIIGLGGSGLLRTCWGLSHGSYSMLLTEARFT
jgi:hypothetical protein